MLQTHLLRMECKHKKKLPVCALPWALLFLAVSVGVYGCTPQGHDYRGVADISDQFAYAHTLNENLDPLTLLSGRDGLEFKPIAPPEDIKFRYDIWLKATLDPQAIGFVATVLEFPVYMLGKVDVWFKTFDGKLIHQHAGAWYPYNERPLKHDGVAFRLPENSKDAISLVVRIRTGTPINFSAMLWAEEQWQHYSHNKRAWYGAFVGAMLALMLYNLFLALTLKDASYLYYVGYMLCMLFTVLFYSGLSEEYFWPAGKTTTYVLMVAGIASFFGVAFVNRFLDIKTHKRWLYIVSTLATAYAAALGIGLSWHIYLAPAAIAGNVMHGLSLLGASYYIGISIVAYFQGIRQARFLALGMSIMVVTLVLYYLSTYGLIRYDRYLYHVLEIGILAEALLMSLALSDRIKILAEEKQALDNKYAQIQRQFSWEIIGIEEAGKKKYASILHDSVGHGLLVLKQHLDGLLKKQTEATAIRDIKRMKQQCTEVMDEVRSLSHDLHPHLLRNLGLRTALLSILKRAFSSSNITCYSDIDEELPAMAKEAEMAIYRITQEAISNILKHACASEVYYSLHVNNHEVHMEIKDDGIGFGKGAVAGGLGLKMMKGHTQLLSGRLDLDSQENVGTKVCLTIPLAPKHS